MAELCKFQKFEIKRVHRRTIKNAQYNPRKITEHAKRKLRDNLRDVGLLGPVIVNSKSGNIVGGHQRLASLDALEGSDDYLLDVAFVELSPKREREQNLFMNNAGAQGEWDIDALAAMLPEIKIENTGFDTIELEMMFSGTDHESFFAKSNQPEMLAQNIDAVEKLHTSASEEIKDRDKSKKIRAQMAKNDTVDDTNTFVVVVFGSGSARDDFVEKLGYARDERYVAGDRVIANFKKP